MAQFDDAKVDDKVWDLRYGWGRITKVDRTLLVARFDSDSGEKHYYTSGKFFQDDLNPTLFYDEVKIVAPPKPEKHKCSYMHNIVRQEMREYGQCECGKEVMTHIDILPNLKSIIYDKPKEKCEACERLKKYKTPPGVVDATVWDIKWLLDKPEHHTCEKGK